MKTYPGCKEGVGLLEFMDEPNEDLPWMQGGSRATRVHG